MPISPDKTLLTVPVTRLERDRVKAAALKAGLSVNNYVRRLLGLPLLQHGGKREVKKGK